MGAFFCLGKSVPESPQCIERTEDLGPARALHGWVPDQKWIKPVMLRSAFAVGCVIPEISRDLYGNICHRSILLLIYIKRFQKQAIRFSVC